MKVRVCDLFLPKVDTERLDTKISITIHIRYILHTNQIRMPITAGGINNKLITNSNALRLLAPYRIYKHVYITSIWSNLEQCNNRGKDAHNNHREHQWSCNCKFSTKNVLLQTCIYTWLQFHNLI